MVKRKKKRVVKRKLTKKKRTAPYKYNRMKIDKRMNYIIGIRKKKRISINFGKKRVVKKKTKPKKKLTKKEIDAIERRIKNSKKTRQARAGRKWAPYRKIYGAPPSIPDSVFDQRKRLK